jgi:hypothetical protein
VAVPQLNIFGYFLAHCLLEVELHPEDAHADAISTSQLVDFAKPGVDIAVLKAP